MSENQIVESQTPFVTKEVHIYELLLLLAAAIWGLSFVVLRSATVELPATYVVGIRYLGAAIIVGITLKRRIVQHFDLNHILPGAVLGVLIYFGFGLMSVSAMGTTPGKNAFLTTAYCVFVPFLAFPFTRRAPNMRNIVAGIICLIGIACISLHVSDGALSMHFSEMIAVLSAVFLGLHMVVVAHFSRKNRDMLVLTFYQFLTSGLIGFAIGFTSTPFPVEKLIIPSVLFDLGYLVLLSTCVGSLLQNICQEHVPAAQASLLIASEAIFGLMFGVLLIHEQVRIIDGIGFLLISAAILINEIGYKQKTSIL